MVLYIFKFEFSATSVANKAPNNDKRAFSPLARAAAAVAPAAAAALALALTLKPAAQIDQAGVEGARARPAREHVVDRLRRRLGAPRRGAGLLHRLGHPAVVRHQRAAQVRRARAAEADGRARSRRHRGAAARRHPLDGSLARRRHPGELPTVRKRGQLVSQSVMSHYHK